MPVVSNSLCRMHANANIGSSCSFFHALCVMGQYGLKKLCHPTVRTLIEVLPEALGRFRSSVGAATPPETADEGAA